jgi:hypothetical protein
MPHKWTGKGRLKFNDKDTPTSYVDSGGEIPVDKVTPELFARFKDQIVEFEKIVEKPKKKKQ